MKNLKIKSLKKIIYLFSFSAILFASCDAEGVHTNYVGTWSAKVLVQENEIFIEYKDIVTLTEYSFTTIKQISVDDKWVNLVKLTGSFKVAENKMTFNIAEAGISSLNQQSGKPTGEIIMYKSETDEYKSILAQNAIATSYISVYSITENQLTLMTDKNENGDYTDANETVVYTKQ